MQGVSRARSVSDCRGVVKGRLPLNLKAAKPLPSGIFKPVLCFSSFSSFSILFQGVFLKQNQQVA